MGDEPLQHLVPIKQDGQECPVSIAGHFGSQYFNAISE